MSKLSGMSQEVYGNLFEPGQKSRLCRLRVSAHHVRATEHAPAEGTRPREFEFPLTPGTVSFAGDDGTVVLLENGSGQKLYSDRVHLEPLLKEAGSGALLGRLSREGARVKMDGRRALMALAGFAASIVLMGFLGLTFLNWGVDRAIDQIPITWENSLGEAVVSSLDGPEIVDPKIVEPVRAVLDRLVTAAGDQPYDFTLHVVENDQVNAMAAPGGQVIVYTGLLKKTKNSEELAGVLGHEIQHVLGRHGLRNVIHSLKWQLAAALLLGDVSSVQHLLLANGSRFLSLSYGRGLEEEADLEGCRLLMQADIDPKGLSDFFKILQEQESEASFVPPEMLSSHPETSRRVAELETYIASQPRRPVPYLPINADWKGMQESLSKLK